MKVTIYTEAPRGFEATSDITIFSPIDDPSVCVMCQRYSQSRLLVNGQSIWVAIRTERVEKIKFVKPEEERHEQVQDSYPGGRPRHD